MRESPILVLTVYPRVGGGAGLCREGDCIHLGLSPRGRGSHRDRGQTHPEFGSIPAWAGEPGSRDAGPETRKVYPRVGGGAMVHRTVLFSACGLSPRGRGSPRRSPSSVSRSRSIPAWAGEPSIFPGKRLRPQVYPRVGGGAESVLEDGVQGDGLSPRGRGSHLGDFPRRPDGGSIPAWAGEPGVRRAGLVPNRVYPRVGGGAKIEGVTPSRSSGLSPRGRGSLGAVDVLDDLVGSIPAWAGEPRSCTRSSGCPRVYPRVGGGALIDSGTDEIFTGLSPRGRGSRIGARASRRPDGSIPAWAGEPSSTDTPWMVRRVYPRVGGGARSASVRCDRSSGLSPRGRGSLTHHEVALGTLRSIPAWAGEPRGRARCRTLGKVYPRVGGGASSIGCATRTTEGLSPRGRGSLVLPRSIPDKRRSIPAWAGEPSGPSGCRWPLWVYPRVGGGAGLFTQISPRVAGLSPRGRGSPCCP